MATTRERDGLPASFPIAWDPKVPTKLFVLRKDDENAYKIDFQYADPSPGCNQYEVAAFQKILQDFEDADLESLHGAVKFLKKCREHVQDCLFGWFDDPGVDNENRALLEHSTQHFRLIEMLLPLLVDDSEDLFSVPGYLSADIMRFFRCHLIADPTENYPNVETELDHSQQPEEHSFYWEYIEKLVRQGCLHRAAQLLSRHSVLHHPASFYRGYEDDYERRRRENFREDLLLVIDAMKRAPIPGGRIDDFDSETQMNFHSMRYQQIEDSNFLLAGQDVDPASFLLWEQSTHGSAFGWDLESAFSHFQRWSQHIRTVHAKISHRELSKVAGIMAGAVGFGEEESGILGLCSEILYRRPNFVPRDLAKLARLFLDPVEEKGFLSLLPIIEGDITGALTAIFAFGGDSAAALPATLFFLYYSLILKFIPSVFPGTHILLSFLNHANAAILASFSDIDIDLGYRLAVRLTLPHIRLANVDTLAVLVSLVERYSPTTDRDAESMVELVFPLIQGEKSLPILEACTCMIFSRFNIHLLNQDISSAVTWLRSGMDIEGEIYEDVTLAPCGRRLGMICVDTSRKILEEIDDESSILPSLAYGRKVLEGVKNEDNGLTRDEELLDHIVDYASFLLESSDPESIKISKAAPQLSACLVASKDDRDGHLRCLAPVFLVWPLILHCSRLMKIEDNSSRLEDGQGTQSAFDRSAIASILTHIEKLECMKRWGNVELVDDEVVDVRRDCARALARAIVVENRRKQEVKPPSHLDESYLHTVNTVNLCNESLSTQRKYVRKMLDGW